jgi:hypothetical protein
MESVFNKNMVKPTKPQTNIIMYILYAVVIILLLLFIILIANYYITDCSQYKPFSQYFTDLSFDPCTQSGPSTEEEREAEDEEEVFHISNQDYTYEQAKCKCAAYGAKLATKEDVIDAYNKGADWCSYGWTHGQTAYYPTQKCTWDKLQRGPRRWRNSCGDPGVNGGYFADPFIRFGVNCYGVKPAGRLVKEKKPECKGKDFCARRENRRSSERLDTDQIAPFNYKEYSKY